MIISIVIGRGGSSLKRKNLRKLNGHPLLAFPIMASLDSEEVDLTFFCSEDKEMKSVARDYGAVVLDRPKELATSEALGEDVFAWAYKLIEKGTQEKVEFVLPLFGNAVGLNHTMIDEMVTKLRKMKDADSICTLSEYSQYSPYRMRKIAITDHPEAGIVDAWVEPFFDGIDWSDVNCDRSSGEKAYIYDCCCAVVKPHCLLNLKDGMPPQKWLGNKILPYTKYRNIPCADIDEEFQFSQMKMWLDKYWR